jgi:hypothetical protein
MGRGKQDFNKFPVELTASFLKWFELDLLTRKRLRNEIDLAVMLNYPPTVMRQSFDYCLMRFVHGLYQEQSSELFPCGP